MPKAEFPGMREFCIVLVCAALFLCGCAHTYVVTLTNGSRMTTSSKPKLKNGFYYFKDPTGKETFVSQGRVREIAPESLARDEKTQFKAPPAK